jgi:crossover junction endodeoxyribonuclease RuvC
MERIILGIDPGSQIMCYGIIACKGKDCRLLGLGVVQTGKHKDGMEKMQVIFRETNRLIQLYSATEAAIEAPFFGKNIQSMLKLGRAQGIAIAAALHNNLSVHEYAPRKIKQSITGKGTASKEQVAEMLRHLLKIEEMPQYLDATDGLAAAVCHFFQNGIPESTGSKTTKKKYGSWESFVTENKSRVK